MTVLQEIVFALGSFGLVLAFLWLAFRKKRTPELEESAPQAKPQAPDSKAANAVVADSVASDSVSASWWKALSKTRSRFTIGRSSAIQELKDALEEACLVSDLGVSNTAQALETLDWKKLAALKEEDRETSAKESLARVFSEWLEQSSEEWPLPNTKGDPKVFWFVGVNGVGKTTSIAKLAAELKGRGYSVLLAAGDTFRAAAGEQLETWGKRLGVDCIRGADGADSSSVLFDAIESAKARKIDFVLCDSAGRLHNQSQLMEALAKNKRVMAKALPEAPHETILVLDAHTGQNMLAQAKQFQESVGLTGLVLTKMDGTARGGAVVAVARQTRTPIRRLGLGESEKDFVSFDSERFVEAILGLNHH